MTNGRVMLTRRRATWASLALVTAWCFGVGLPACNEGTTGGARVSLRTRVELRPEAKLPFTTLRGWQVQLDSALIGHGPFYYFDGAPPLARSTPGFGARLARRSITELLSVRVARAHPGHYASGTALGQALIPSSTDLWAGETWLAEGEGVTGNYRSASFSFMAGEGPFASQLGEAVALAIGTARKPAETERHFRALAKLADIEHTAAQGVVTGCVFVPAEVRGSGVITLRVDPRVWFELVDFSEIEPGSPTKLEPFPDDSQPRIAFSQGLASFSAYEFSFAAD
ncbi:MAG TPA: hypothetical protein VFQ61_34645 [Polyangiaceae bacterium]|nr:hypothetical protein [Polyangiaceae bacterium]